jgi:hypothetical protein
MSAPKILTYAKSAYHRLAKLLHRDPGGTDEDMATAERGVPLSALRQRACVSRTAAPSPRHEPPPPPPPKPAPREPFFTPAARKVWNWIVLTAVALAAVAALFSDPRTPKTTVPAPVASPTRANAGHTRVLARRLGTLQVTAPRQNHCAAALDWGVGQGVWPSPVKFLTVPPRA